MKHIHISLVGSQVYPVYLCIADLQPDGVILVHSGHTVGEAHLVSGQIAMPCQLLELDPVDVDAVFARVRALRGQIDDEDSYSINLSGGTKVWSIAFYECFRFLPNVRLFYVDQNSRIYDICHQESHLSTVEIDIDQAFRLNGIKTPKYTPFADYTRSDRDCLQQIVDLRAFSYEGFRLVSQPDDNQQKDLEQNPVGEFDFGQHKLCWDKEKSQVQVVLTGRYGKRKSLRLSSPHIFSLFFHAGWFELWVACILSKWKYAKELRMNLRFPYSGNQHPKNEIDIVVNTGNRLLFVECKTQIYDITDIDKFRTAVKNYGGMGAKSLFITWERMKDTAAEKCKDSNILSFSLADSTLCSPEQMLYLLLEQELFAINKK